MRKREQEILVKAFQAEQARQRAALEISRQQEEIKRYQMHIEMMQAQLNRSEEDVKTLEQQRDDAERSATKARENARLYKQTLAEWKAREEGREEGRRAGMVRGYSDGHYDGIRDGRYRGYEEGRSIGVQEGRSTGEQDGRAFERRRAIEEFDRFAKVSGLDRRDSYENVRHISPYTQRAMLTHNYQPVQRRREAEEWSPDRTGRLGDPSNPIPVELSSPSSETHALPEA